MNAVTLVAKDPDSIVVYVVTVDEKDQGAYRELCYLGTVVGGNGFVGGGNERNLERRDEGL